MTPKIEKLVDNLQLGEGPHWDVETQSLYFVDMLDNSIHKYVPSTRKHTKANVGHASLIIPVQGKNDQFVIGLDRELVLITWDGESETVSIVEKLYKVDEDKSNNAFNDGKCDPSGRLWAGTLYQTPDGNILDEQGSLYSFQNKKITKHASKIGIANGLAFDTSRNKFYYIDSFRGTLDQYDFDIKNGTISNKKPIFTLKEGVRKNFQVLDGMTIDTDGNLWVAVFGLSKVLKIDPRKPETIADTIQFPADQITSVAFGGPNLDELYVTSGRIGLTGDAPPDEGGILYRVTGLNAKGLPGVRVVL